VGDRGSVSSPFVHVKGLKKSEHRSETHMDRNGRGEKFCLPLGTDPGTVIRLGLDGGTRVEKEEKATGG